jgi:hypothetical protein
LNGLREAKQNTDGIEARFIVDERSPERDRAESYATQRQSDEPELLDTERGGDVGEEVYGVVQAGADVEAIRAQTKVCFQAGDSGVPEVCAVYSC